jgi:hypothetical protein
MLTVLSGARSDLAADQRRPRSRHGRRHKIWPEPKLTKHQAREAVKRVAAGEPLREIAYRPELHYMRGPGPKWREAHVHLHKTR